MYNATEFERDASILLGSAIGIQRCPDLRVKAGVMMNMAWEAYECLHCSCMLQAETWNCLNTLRSSAKQCCASSSNLSAACRL